MLEKSYIDKPPTKENISGLKSTDSPVFVTTKLTALTDGKIPYHVNDATGLADGPTKTDVDDAVTKKHANTLDHTQGTDTALGTMAADINMGTHQVTALSVPDAVGEAIRQTAKITEAALEALVDNTGVVLPIIADPNDGELHLTPKAASNGAEGTIFYCNDKHVYVGVEPL